MPALFNAVPSVATGDWITAGWTNTYIGGNFSAVWPYDAAGQIAYSVGAAELSKLSKPSVDSVLKNTSLGVPSWLALTQLKGALHAIGTVDFAPGGQSFASTWADITGATLTLTLAVTCTVVVLAQITGYNPTTGNAFIVRGMVDGTGDAAANQVFNGGSTTAARNEALGYIYRATGITAGSRVVKMQCQANGSTNYVERGRLIAAAFVE
jgi:hypothetical protein